ncbi:hypothetical protein M422DRAFT_45370 [Sphaerobolus stellatus SS14]|nr:hypothetical protein M422DRAFT_45370 [Sphaerobolus stellatus SS14]
MTAGIQQLMYIFDSSFEVHGKLITGSADRAHAYHVAISHFYYAILHGYNLPRDPAIVTWLKHRHHNFRKILSSREIAELVLQTMVKKNDTPDWLNFLNQEDSVTRWDERAMWITSMISYTLRSSANRDVLPGLKAASHWKAILSDSHVQKEGVSRQVPINIYVECLWL